MKRSFLSYIFAPMLVLVCGCSEGKPVTKPHEQLRKAQVDEWNAGRQPQRSELPEDAQEYLRIIEANPNHPHIKKYFHQVTLCYIQGPTEPVPFFLIEFRDGLNSGMVWTDGNGNWGTGGWLPIATENAIPQVGTSYLQSSPAYPSCLAAIVALIEMKRSQ